MSVVLPRHRDLSIYHNWHHTQNCTVEELFEGLPFNPDEWDSELALQKCKATDELWSMHWLVETMTVAPPEFQEENKEGIVWHDVGQTVHSLYAPTFKDLLKLMMTHSQGALIDYE
jgi:hypothetical protein